MILVEITATGHGVLFNLAYAGADNFTGRPVYQRAACYLHVDAVPLLVAAVRLAAVQGLRLKVFDAFRPAEAQWVMWRHTPDPGFLADPKRGSPHSRGIAVDLTLVDSAGCDLDMGTSFDAFTARSHHGSTAVSAGAQRNRTMLLGLMIAAGWDFYRNEWWHYQIFDSHRYPLLGDSVLPLAMM
jgi:D-alanyl-D-alanine dipeptidase